MIYLDREEKEIRKQRLKELIQQSQKKRLEEEYTNLASVYKEDYQDINSVEILSEEESESIYDKLQDNYPLVSYGIGGIDWNLMKNKMEITTSRQIQQFINEQRYDNVKVYSLKKASGYPGTPPVLVTPINNIIKSFNDLKYVEQILYCIEKKFVLEINFSGKILLGWK
ncbi:CDI toxin immunity protein [Gottfriedia solisilvae]|uniref:CDI toxin immunity protein n=1 Tax=Gottfriedia solisilvae TaxID=1516104 RepID=UPI001151084F|nr:hypothetical protein [Gottfriedia solisilvae]